MLDFCLHNHGNEIKQPKWDSSLVTLLSKEFDPEDGSSMFLLGTRLKVYTVSQK
jgi:hypothetical protein